jgi:pimeloyl-ACP methyl ester carboxylesterase
MPTLERDGIRIAYEVHGNGDARSPVLLTHGFGQSRRMWDANLDALTEQRRAIGWDMRGHGESDAPVDGSLYTHEACLGDMEAVLDAAGVASVVLCGMSLGGFLSLAFRVRFPERVAGLVLTGTGPGFRDSGARARWNERASGAAATRARLLLQGDDAAIASLPEIAVPVLVIVGSGDQSFLHAADVMERRIPGARKVVLEGAGHGANMDAPEEWNAAVREFLQEVG